MKKEGFRKIGLWLLLGVFTCFIFVPTAHAQKFQVSVFGGWNHVFEYGSEDDYVLGENDFPVTPAHTPFNFGAALAVYITSRIGVELDSRYTISSKVILTDPSDQDTVEIASAKHYSITLNFVYRFLNGRLRPYFLIGGGMDKLIAEEETYVSEYGYEIELLPPEKTTDLVVNVGSGVQYFILSRFGARLDVRYSIIFADPHNQNNLNVTFGIFLGF